MKSVVKGWIPVAVVLLAAVSAWGGSAILNPDEITSIRKVMESYRNAWLANDVEGVLGSFTQDAVLMPHHGVEPVEGMKAIREFWFPGTAAKTTILKFVRSVDEVGGEGGFAHMRGHSEVAWRVEDKGTAEEWRTHGTYLAILKKQGNGKWLITHLIWDDVPNERVR